MAIVNRRSALRLLGLGVAAAGAGASCSAPPAQAPAGSPTSGVLPTSIPPGRIPALNGLSKNGQLRLDVLAEPSSTLPGVASGSVNGNPLQDGMTVEGMASISTKKIHVGNTGAFEITTLIAYTHGDDLDVPDGNALTSFEVEGGAGSSCRVYIDEVGVHVSFPPAGQETKVAPHAVNTGDQVQYRVTVKGDRTATHVFLNEELQPVSIGVAVTDGDWVQAQWLTSGANTKADISETRGGQARPLAVESTPSTPFFPGGRSAPVTSLPPPGGG